MAKAMTKSQIAEHLAKKVEIKKSQAVAVLDEIAKLSYKEAKNSFTLPASGRSCSFSARPAWAGTLRPALR